VTGTVFVPQGELKWTAKVPARLLTEMTVYLVRPPSPPRDSEKTAMSGQLSVVALTPAAPLTLMEPEPPPAGMDKELSLTDSAQRPSPGLSASRLVCAVDATFAPAAVAVVAAPRRASPSVAGFASTTLALGALAPSAVRSLAVPCAESGD
jgi:hypothetical protein